LFEPISRAFLGSAELNFPFTRKRAAFVIAAFILGCRVAELRPQSEGPLQLKQTIALPGVEGRLDHFAFDRAGQRLFVCALGNNTIEVIDLRKGERIHSISGLGSPQGVLYVPEFDRLFVANDKNGLLKIYDAKSFQSVGELNLKDDADNLRYDEAARKVYVGFGSGGIALVAAADGKQLGAIKLTAHPEAFVLERRGGRVFVNVPNSRHVAVIDRDKGRVIATWRPPAFENFPIALDETSHRLFVGCRLPSKLVVLNTDSGVVVTKIDISGDPDDLFYNERRHCIYAICGAGKIDIVEQAGPDGYKATTKISTATGARTGLFVPEWDTLFVAIPHRGSQPAEIRAYHVD
jgi:hypothetical protein